MEGDAQFISIALSDTCLFRDFHLILPQPRTAYVLINPLIPSSQFQTRCECCYSVRAKGLFKSHFKLNRDLMKYQLTVSAPAASTFVARELVEADVLERASCG